MKPIIIIIILLFSISRGAGELPAPSKIELWDENSTEDFIWDIENSILSLNRIKDMMQQIKNKSCFLFHPVDDDLTFESDDTFQIKKDDIIPEYDINSSYKALFLDISERMSFYPKIKYIIINNGEIIYGESYIVSTLDKNIMFDNCRDADSFRKTVELSNNSILNSINESIKPENLKMEIRKKEIHVEKSVTDNLLAQILQIKSIDRIYAKKEEIIDFVDVTHNIAPFRIGDNITYIGFDNKIFSIFISQYLSNDSIVGNLGDALYLWFHHIQEKEKRINDKNINEEIKEMFNKMIINTYFLQNRPQCELKSIF